MNFKKMAALALALSGGVTAIADCNGSSSAGGSSGASGSAGASGSSAAGDPNHCAGSSTAAGSSGSSGAVASTGGMPGVTAEDAASLDSGENGGGTGTIGSDAACVPTVASCRACLDANPVCGAVSDDIYYCIFVDLTDPRCTQHPQSAYMNVCGCVVTLCSKACPPCSWQ